MADYASLIRPTGYGLRATGYFASYGDSFIFRGPIRSADGVDNIRTALLLELPDRAAADKFWNEEPFAKNGGDRGGCADYAVGVWGLMGAGLCTGAAELPMSDRPEKNRVDFLPGNPLSYTTTKIKIFRDDIELGTASGFVVKFGQKFALVTNWHVLSGYNPASGKCLSNTGALPNRIECHVAVSRPLDEAGRAGEEIHFKPLAIQLLMNDNPVWIDDRDSDSQNDYAIIGLADHVPELKGEGVTLRSILGGRVTFRRGHQAKGDGPYHIDDVQSIYPAIGSEVFVLGYPRGIAPTGVFPIWKRASVASEPQASITLNGIEHKNVFYIDALTKSGMSGSPVVYLAKPGDHLHAEDGVSVTIKEAGPYIVGVYAGRDGVTQEEYELSMGRVWKIGAVERLLMKSA